MTASAPLLLQQAPRSTDLMDLILSAGPVARIVLLMLALFSVFSLAVILDRFLTLRKADRQSREFLDVFRESSKFSQVRTACNELDEAPLSTLFLAGESELSSQMEGRRDGGSGGGRIRLDNLERSLRRAARSERRRLERMMLFLATTGAVTPFIGLFGTVWGIMNAFRSIGTYGTANLAVVAPGISEALITTAAGLAAAIPAVVGYNHLLGKIRGLSAMMEDFALEFLNVVERTFGDGAGPGEDGS